MTSPLQRIKAAIIDGRCREPRYIQKQLLTLHDALVREAAKCHEAIIRDTGCSSSEAWFEVHLTVQAIKHQYGTIDFRDCLEQEYSLAHSRNNTSRRMPFGCVYLVPSHNNRLYSTLQPSCAAIAAGNCVVIEMEQRLLETEKVLRDLVQQNMDKDAFVIVEQRPTEDEFFTEQVIIASANSDQDIQSHGSAKLLISPPSTAIAVVDRSANISKAAKDIVQARFRFCGKSPYAPDLVLVNDFALKEFCQAAVQYLTQDLSSVVNPSGISNPQTRGVSQTELQAAGATTLVSGVNGTIQLLRTREKSVPSKKVNEPLLLIAPMSSLDDAIDTANASDSSLLAAYVFADVKAAKYLSQFIASRVSLTNFIPPQLLVGPPAPQGYSTSFAMRYSKEMFSFPSPEHIASPPSANSCDRAANDVLEDTSSNKAGIEKLKQSIQEPLLPMGEPAGKSIGFFEQGLFTGLATGAVVVTSLLAVSARYVVPVILQKVGRGR